MLLHKPFTSIPAELTVRFTEHEDVLSKRDKKE
jgi:hypothetical protein